MQAGLGSCQRGREASDREHHDAEHVPAEEGIHFAPEMWGRRDTVGLERQRAGGKTEPEKPAGPAQRKTSYVGSIESPVVADTESLAPGFGPTEGIAPEECIVCQSVPAEDRQPALRDGSRHREHLRAEEGGRPQPPGDCVKRVTGSGLTAAGWKMDSLMAAREGGGTEAGPVSVGTFFGRRQKEDALRRQLP